MKKLIIAFLFVVASVLYSHGIDAAGPHGDVESDGTTSSSYTGLITEIWINDRLYTDVAWVGTETDIINPACTNKRWFLLDMTREDMKLAFTTALTAFSSGKQVQLGGDGNCVYTNFEALKYIAIK